MKILGTLFRLICALVVLLAIAVYLDGPLQVSLVDYLGAFTPGHLQALATPESWLTIAAGALLLLTLCCGLKLGWNLFYSLVTLAFFAEVALMTLGPELAMPTATRGLGWEQFLRELSINYPVPAVMIPALCIIGCLCSSAPVRIAWTSLLSCLLCYGCAELLSWGVAQWQAMPEPFLPHVLDMVKTLPWSLAALPAVFFIQYSLFMAMFETFIPRRKKADTKVKKEEDKKPELKKEEKPAEARKPASATTVNIAATAAPVKRPVIHKKSPIAATAAEPKKDSPKPEEKKEKAPEEAPRADAPAEEKKEEAPRADAPAEEKKEEAPKADAPAQEAAKSEEKAESPTAAPASGV